MELEVQKLLRTKGLDWVKEELKLEVKIKGNLVLLKYNQIEADWTKTALYDCRGLILDLDNNFEIVAYPYKKFFNVQEGYAAKMDWDSVKHYIKEDGSLITLYFYKGEWHVSTSGVPDASSTCNMGEITFADLTWNTIVEMYGSKEEFISKLDPNYNYIFELCTPFNLVITQHTTSKLLLHGVRNMTTLLEESIDPLMDTIKCVEEVKFKSIDDLRATLVNMPWQQEGYIHVDKHFNRVKEKNPAYVDAHHVATGLSPYHIMGVVKNNELGEFLSYFPSREAEMEDLQRRYNALADTLENIYKSLKSFEGSDKDYAAKVFETCNLNNCKDFAGLFFSLRKGKCTIKEFLNAYSNRDLFHILAKVS